MQVCKYLLPRLNVLSHLLTGKTVLSQHRLALLSLSRCQMASSANAVSTQASEISEDIEYLLKKLSMSSSSEET
jgi:hypothetical protein